MTLSLRDRIWLSCAKWFSGMVDFSLSKISHKLDFDEGPEVLPVESRIVRTVPDAFYRQQQEDSLKYWLHNFFKEVFTNASSKRKTIDPGGSPPSAPLEMPIPEDPTVIILDSCRKKRFKKAA